MEDKNIKKISLSTFLLIIAIIVITIMCIFIYKLNVEKNNEAKKSTEIQSQINSLNSTMNILQESINTKSNTNITETSAQNNTSNSSIKKEAQPNTSTNADNSKSTTNISNSDDIKYEISKKRDKSNDEIIAVIKATKSDKTMTEEFKMAGTIADTGTMTFPTIGSVALVADTAGEYYGVNVFQLVNGKIKKLGTIDCGADMVKEATYEVTTKGETTAIITAKRNHESIKKEFQMEARIAKAEIIDVLDCGKVVLVAETAGEYYEFKAFRLSQDYINGKTKGIVEAGIIKNIY